MPGSVRAQQTEKTNWAVRAARYYRFCDLLYTYARTFRHPANLDRLFQRRSQISHAIMGILADR